MDPDSGDFKSHQRTQSGFPITPSLLFVGPQADRAEEAITHYTSIFPDSRIEGILRHDGSGPETAGTVKHAQFYHGGETFMAMDAEGTVEKRLEPAGTRRK